MTETFKQIRLYEYGSVDNLVLEEAEREPLQAGEARIAVKASALNRDQLPFIEGTWAGGVAEIDGFTRLGYEGAGVVIEVADDVDPAWIGKEVLPIGSFDVTRYGTEGQEAIVPADRLYEKPENLSFVEGTALWVPYLTAYGLIYDGKLKKGDYVLIPAATAVVGQAAVAIAKSLGAIPIGLSRSADRLQELYDLGLEHAFVQGSETLAEDLMALTNGHGVDLVFDPIGGDFTTLASQVAALYGHIVEYGVLGGLEIPLNAGDLLGKQLTLTGYTMDKLFNDQSAFDQAKDFVAKGVTAGYFKPIVASVYPFADYKTAYAELQTGRKIGRIVLDMEA